MKRTKSRQWNWKDAVIADARRRIQESKQSGQWWQRNVDIDPDLELPERYKSVVGRLFEELKVSGYKLDQKLKDLEILLANLWLQTRRPISISLNTHDYSSTKTRYSRVSPFIIQFVHKLADSEMIEMKIGYKTDTESRKTRICATEKLLETALNTRPGSLLILKN